MHQLGPLVLRVGTGLSIDVDLPGLDGAVVLDWDANVSRPTVAQAGIPVLEVYMSMHQLSAVLLPGLEPVDLLEVTIDSDDGGMGWSLSASGPEHLLEQLAPVGGLPARIRTVRATSSVRFTVDGFTSSSSTFRKDRVLEYLDGCDSQLSDPHSSPPPRIRAEVQRDVRPQILFTGFAAVQRAHLEARADAGGLNVVKTVTQHLVFLCAGPNAGPAKVAKSRSQGVYIVREPELFELLESGELPDYAIDDVVSCTANTQQ